MPLTNIIVNGDFSSSTNTSAANWTGTDIETRASSVYISGTGNSRVAELNGGTGQTTVMEQSFTIDNPQTTHLTLDYALRDSGTVGVDGFRVEVLDGSGNVIATQDVLPTVNSVYQELSVPVTFPSAGAYTLRFTEIGDNADGSGAVIDNVALMVCFAGQTRIKTPQGYCQARDLRVGEMVMTLTGPKPIRWVGHRQVHPKDTESDTRFYPVRITQGALGAGLPTRDLLVSRQHRVMVSTPIAKRMFGQPEVLLPAIKLTDFPGIFVDNSVRSLDYIHLLLDAHEVLFAEDAPAESLLLGRQATAALSDAARKEIDLIFPGLRAGAVTMRPVRPVPPRSQQHQLTTRVAKNNRPLLETYSPQ